MLIINNVDIKFKTEMNCLIIDNFKFLLVPTNVSVNDINTKFNQTAAVRTLRTECQTQSK